LIRKIPIALILLFTGSCVLSQSIFTGHLYNEYPQAFNPAYAGVHVKPHFYFAYRKVASNINGTPESINLGGSARIFGNMSLGGRFYKQSEGLFNTIIGFTDYSYLLKLGKKRSLRFGISAGVNSNSLNYSGVVADDPSGIAEIASDNFEKPSFESSAGVVFQSNKFEFSFAVPKLYSSKGDIGLSANSFVQYNYAIPGIDILLKPSVFVDYKENTPLLYSVNLQAAWNSTFWVGVGYRNRPSLVLSAGIIINRIGVSYASELSMEKYSSMFNQIHEIAVTYTISKKRKVPREVEMDPLDDLALKQDTVQLATEKLETAAVDLISIDEPDMVSTNEDLNEPEFEIVDAGGGVYVLKPINSEETNQDYDSVMLEKIMEPELDYLFAKQLEEKEEAENVEEESDYRVKDAGSGVFVLESNEQNTITNTDKAIDPAVLDSLISKSELFEKVFGNGQEQNVKGAYYHAKYYTIQLFIDRADNELLNNPEVTDMARIETDEEGRVKYYYGYYSSIDEALRQESRLKKFKVKTKVLKFNSY
jgi:type IX secretion system PorP/SprF family membrane protein